MNTNGHEGDGVKRPARLRCACGERDAVHAGISRMESAGMNISSARLGLEFAEDEHSDGDFDSVLWRVNDAMSLLQAAAAKITKHLGRG